MGEAKISSHQDKIMILRTFFRTKPIIIPRQFRKLQKAGEKVLFDPPPAQESPSSSLTQHFSIYNSFFNFD